MILASLRKLMVQGDPTLADVHAERRAALDTIHGHSPGSTRQLMLVAGAKSGASPVTKSTGHLR
ncbi:hypothetical protein CDZ97_18955 [Mameliella alba]|nr:hypothetical protein CDZ95_22580 [Mameliella alba]OWV46500.1 hypothetical protein CDZ96_17985 [Mameliella alba]OWV59897.1 hypothetical protein CDZ97_18955 [Mameliella alba]